MVGGGLVKWWAGLGEMVGGVWWDGSGRWVRLIASCYCLQSVVVVVVVEVVIVVVLTIAVFLSLRFFFFSFRFCRLFQSLCSHCFIRSLRF